MSQSESPERSAERLPVVDQIAPFFSRSISARASASRRSRVLSLSPLVLSLSLYFLAPLLCVLAQALLLGELDGELFLAGDHPVEHGSEPDDHLVGVREGGVARVEAEPGAFEGEVEAENARSEAAGLGHDAHVGASSPSRGELVADEALAGAVEVEVLLDAEPGVALDVGFLVLPPVSGDVDLQHEVEAPALAEDDPAHPLVGLDVRDGEHVGEKRRSPG